MLRIQVAIHNVEEGKIYRPKHWATFGTKDLESAAIRTYKNFALCTRKRHEITI